MSRLAEHVTGLSPLGEALDGTERPKRRRGSSPARAKAPIVGTWVCPRCGEVKDDAAEQARHLAAEMSHLMRKSRRPIDDSRPDRARQLRATGMKWWDIASTVGYASAGAAHNAANRAGLTEADTQAVAALDPGTPDTPDERSLT